MPINLNSATAHVNPCRLMSFKPIFLTSASADTQSCGDTTAA